VRQCSGTTPDDGTRVSQNESVDGKIADRRFLVTDAAYDQAVLRAIGDHGEIVVLILRHGGARDFFIAATEQEWRAVASRASGSWGRSDRVEVYATGELPIRGEPNDENRQRALDVVAVEHEVVLATRVPGDVQLHDVEEAGTVDVAEWFEAVAPGAFIVAGPHPFRHEDAYPYGDQRARPDILVGYRPNDSGVAAPGAY
jgi:hypothetical protein